MKGWEVVADNLKKAGLSSGWVSALDLEGRTIWITDAHRDNGKRFVVRADEKLTAFLVTVNSQERGSLLFAGQEGFGLCYQQSTKTILAAFPWVSVDLA